MKLVFEEIYQSMLTAIADCRKKGPDFRTEIECCFQISRNYWALVQQEKNAESLSTGEEIEFCKQLKPKFLASIKYYHLVYHAELFRPEEPEIMKEFWIRESQRHNRFILDNKEFYHYYKNGGCRFDEEYFLQTSAQKEEQRIPCYGAFIAELLALERYLEYANTQLSFL